MNIGKMANQSQGRWPVDEWKLRFELKALKAAGTANLARLASNSGG